MRFDPPWNWPEDSGATIVYCCLGCIVWLVVVAAVVGWLVFVR